MTDSGVSMRHRGPHRQQTSGLQQIGQTQGFAALLEELRLRHRSRPTRGDGENINSASRTPIDTSLRSQCPLCRRMPRLDLRHCLTCHFDVADGDHGWVVTEAVSDLDRQRARVPLPCPTCVGTEGYDNARRRAAFQSLLIDARLPRNSESWDLDSYRARIGGEVEKVEALRIVAAFSRGDLGRLDPPMRNLYLWGPLGVGKTGLAVSILRARLHQGQPGVYFTLPDLLDRIRRTFERQAGDADDATDTLLRKLREIDLLVLDDLGVERPTAWVLEKLFQILDGRMRDERETVFTSNLDMVAMRTHLGERVMERVVYQTWDVEVGGRNLRYTPALADIVARHPNSTVG